VEIIVNMKRFIQRFLKNNISKFKIDSIICVIFVIMICFYGFSFGKYCINEKKVSRSFFNNITFKDTYIDLYGLMQNVFGKKQIENFTIFKNDYEKLISPRRELSEKEVKEKVDELEPIIRYIQANDSKQNSYIYISSLLPIMNEKHLIYGVTDYSIQNAQHLHSEISKRKIKLLDLNESPFINNISEENRFYKTDHHWTNDLCFATYQTLIEYFNKEKIFEYEHTTYLKENFKNINFENSFLGSYGVKVGECYAGKDNFNYLEPNFNTEFLFYAIDSNGELIKEKKGDWSTALMDHDILNDLNYDNKYNVFLNTSSVESIIVNKKKPNDLKLLLISHSYGRPLAQYLALDFAEVRVLDPQEGRFSGNYINYINEYNPDYVVFLVEFEGEIIGKYNTDGM